MQTKEIEKKLDAFLLKVQKPGRYVGGEFNSVMKDPSVVATRVALAFPDIYDLGVPNLGLSIFYDQLNKMTDVWAERTYLPWEDMEAEMRSREIPLYTLESKTPISDMDILGITIPYESLYTNVLTMLDLSGMSVFSSERDEKCPLVIAGGHSTFNPEPMAPFIDAFVIGEGEEVFPEIIACYQKWKRNKANKLQLLENLSQIEGVYIPSFYEPTYNDDGTVAAITPIHEGVKARIKKRILPVLPEPPEKFIVPSIDVVQNRVAIEIMRGCSRGCRFCQAGFITRPVRERPVDMVVRSLSAALEDTGYEEAALLSLSSSDYRPIRELVTELHGLYQQRKLNIALPSLRIDTVSVDILEQLRGSRAGGFTLAPEAASEKIKKTINKYITEEQLLNTAEVIYGRGWSTIKLYFMIGLPNETMEDVQAIADLAIKVIKIGRRLVGKRSQLNLGVATFVPKPHTPFQWAQLDDPEVVAEKQTLLMKALKTPGIKISWSEPDSTMFEAWSTRGDRRLSKVIYRAWQLGAKLDAWADHYKKEAWMQAFEENGLSPEFYVHRQRKADEVFPWDVIDTGVSKRTLRREYENSLNGVLRPDCRTGCYGCGIVQAFHDIQPEKESDLWFCPIPEKR
ncbi:MAG: TIGR03960 family B12-binding radical SAM protein [Anaerolineaceae bacterium]|nr:TIGR03960 family B12-binding radical SAM protein [Anaerolineaceae bacterium]